MPDAGCGWSDDGRHPEPVLGPSSNRPGAAQARARWHTGTLGYHSGVEDPNDVSQAAVEGEYRSPRMALGLSALSTLVPALVGATMLGLGANSRRRNDALLIGGVTGLGLGLSFGPSIGYAYSGEHFRGWGMGLLRLVGVGVGSTAILAAVLAGMCENSDCSGAGSGHESDWVVLAVVSFTPVLISAVYDIATAPSAARRANARHGLSNLGLVPVAIPGRASASPGLSLVGQF